MSYEDEFSSAIELIDKLDAGETTLEKVKVYPSDIVLESDQTYKLQFEEDIDFHNFCEMNGISQFENNPTGYIAKVHNYRYPDSECSRIDIITCSAYGRILKLWESIEVHDSQSSSFFQSENYSKFIDLKERFRKNQEMRALAQTEGNLITYRDRKYKWEEILEELYPGDWDIVLQENNNRYIIIRFPEINITNSSNNSHIIKGLYVLWEIDSKYKPIRSIEGFRSIRTLSEYDSSYNHSHLDNSTYIGRFCLGSTQIARDINHVISSQDNIEWDEVYNALLMLNLYVGWESTEGGPYKLIQNINRRGGGQQRGDFSNTFIEVIYSKIINSDEIKNNSNGIAKVYADANGLKRFHIDPIKLEDVALPIIEEESDTRYIDIISPNGDRVHYDIANSLTLEGDDEIIEQFNTNPDRKSIIFQKELVYQELVKSEEYANMEKFQKRLDVTLGKKLILQLTNALNNYTFNKNRNESEK